MENGFLETDDLADFSLQKSRLDSFRGSGLSEEVSADRLARAGFYFTGYGDRVCCFSCHKTVENWCREDTPVERHREVSPSCKFLTCVYRNSCNQTDTSLPNGSIYNLSAEDVEYRLRTGCVVDETPYPMFPHMKREEARLQTFSSWPLTAPVKPRDLAQAGFYYLGQSDRVQCFCCGGILHNWETGDNAWTEHNKFHSNCFFILGHDVGNIPLQGVEEEAGDSSPETYGNMENFRDRLDSFAGIQHPVGHERLARAGFYSTGTGDDVLCFSCGGGLKVWQPEEDPWEEHAKYYPGCNFLLAEKGQEFVNSIQLQRPNGATSSHQNGVSGNTNDMLLKSDVAQKAIDLGIDPVTVERTILRKMQAGCSYSSVEALVEDCFGSHESPSDRTLEQDEDPLDKLQRLQREKQCKICMDRDISIVFIPCGHLVSCQQCSRSLVRCPICCCDIMQKIKTYNS